MDLLRPTLMLAVICSLGGSALAADAFDKHACNVTLLQAKSVQKELGITETQRAKMNVHADRNNAQGMEIDRLVSSNKITIADATIRVGRLRSELKKRVVGELNSAQIIRLREISLQQAGALALLDPVVGTKIGMSKAQTDLIRAKYVEHNAQAQKIKGDAFGPIDEKYKRMKPANEEEARKLQEQFVTERTAKQKEILPKLIALATEFDKAVEAVMTKGQIESYKKLKGKVFKPKTGSE
ncbi:MAG: hypothetical protein IH944_02355 [Armatimonadetes bacterium]|nr:hypothetical protein [Armatimonadota bacterium]